MQAIKWRVWSQSIVFNISEAFNKVWQSVVAFKLKHIGFRKNLLELLPDFLKDKKHRVVLNGKVSNCGDVRAKVLMRPINDLQQTFLYSLLHIILTHL